MEHKCVKEADVAALKENVLTLFKITKENREIIKQVEERQDMLYELTKSVAVIAEQITTIKDDVKEVKSDMTAVKQEINSMQKKEGESWGKFKWLIVALLVTLIGGFLFKIIVNGG